MKKKILAALLAVVLAVSLLPGTAWAADGPETSGNINGQNYGTWAATVTSYLYENESGGLTRVEYVPAVEGLIDHGGEWSWGVISEERIVVEDYSSSFVFQSGRSVPMELDIWGGFFAGETYNFLVFGQTNSEEDDSKEVIRVVKYSKDWQRLGQASLYGANTTIPFRAGSLRMAEYDGELYIRTSHQMYKSSDGLNHQANLTMAVRESDMTVLDSYYIVMNPKVGYVSHSFNQFVIVDQQRRIVTLDHGDGYPRGAALMVYDTKAGQGKFSGSVSSTVVQSFQGDIGANLTGASLGGLAETSNGYAVAYNYVGEGNSLWTSPRSVCFAYVDKDSLSATTKALSDAGTGTTRTPVLAPTGPDGGYILWNTYSDDTLYYAAYSDGGSVGEVRTATAPLSDCQPICYNGKVVWYVTDDSGPVFYTLDDSGVNKFLVDARDQFTDLADDAFYLAPVAWAVNEGITSGTGDGTTFSPEDSCTRAQIVTFLWRAYGKPEPTSTKNPFTDVKSSDYYYEAVLWAVENGITSGRTETTFDPYGGCTRKEAVTFQWRAAGKPSVSGGSSFTDVPGSEWYSDAVAWAAASGISLGNGDGTFGPDTSCTRAQIVTFLYRDPTIPA